MSDGTGSKAPVAPNWPIMSVPIWLTSGVVPPAIAVWSLATAWPQSTGVTVDLDVGVHLHELVGERAEERPLVAHRPDRQLAAEIPGGAGRSARSGRAGRRVAHPSLRRRAFPGSTRNPRA